MENNIVERTGYGAGKVQVQNLALSLTAYVIF